MGEEVNPPGDAEAPVNSVTPAEPPSPVQLPLPIDASPASAVTKQDFGMFGFVISVVVAFFVPILQMSFADLPWGSLAGADVILIAISVWTFCTHAVPHRSLIIQTCGSLAIIATAGSLSVFATLKLYRIQHSPPMLNAAEQALNAKFDTTSSKVAAFDRRLNEVIMTNRDAAGRDEALKQFQNDWRTWRMLDFNAMTTNWQDELRVDARKRISAEQQERQRRYDAWEANYQDNRPAYDYALNAVWAKLKAIAQASGDQVDATTENLPVRLDGDGPTNIEVETIGLHKDPNWNFRVTLHWAYNNWEQYLTAKCDSGDFQVDCSGGKQDILTHAYDFAVPAGQTGQRQDFKTPISNAIHAVFAGHILYLDDQRSKTIIKRNP
jgi:hypothetical protein